MKQFFMPILVVLALDFAGCGGNKGIMRDDSCDAPGLEWMEAVEGYDKQEVIDLASKSENSG